MTTENVIRLGPVLESKSLTLKIRNFSWYQSTVRFPGEGDARDDHVVEMSFGPYTFHMRIALDFSSKNILVWFGRCDDKDGSVRADCSLELVNQDHRFNAKCQLGGCSMPKAHKFCSQTSLGHFNTLLSPGFLLDDTLTFYWTVTMPKPDFDSDLRDKMSKSALDTFSSSMLSLLNSGRFSDVKLLVGDSVELAAHSQVLAAQSPVFAAMLSHGMQEQHSKQVKIKDFNVDTMRNLLGFMYSGRLPTHAQTEDSDTLALLAAANCYQVQSLIDLCANALMLNLTNTNVSEMLIQADMLGVEVLKTACLNHMIIGNRLAEVQDTDGYRNLSKKRPHLAADILAAAFPSEPKAKVARIEAPA